MERESLCDAAQAGRVDGRLAQQRQHDTQGLGHWRKDASPAEQSHAQPVVRVVWQAEGDDGEVKRTGTAGSGRKGVLGLGGACLTGQGMC